MGFWCHVNASVVTKKKIPLRRLHSLFGKTFDYKEMLKVIDDAEKNPGRYVPFGSEGSLPIRQYQHNGWNEIDFSGDLRDNCDIDAIVRWFRNSASKFEYDEVLYEGITATSYLGELSYRNWTVDWSVSHMLPTALVKEDEL